MKLRGTVATDPMPMPTPAEEVWAAGVLLANRSVLPTVSPSLSVTSMETKERGRGEGEGGRRGEGERGEREERGRKKRETVI